MCVQTVKINISSSRALHRNDDGGGVVDPKLLFIYLSDTDPASASIQIFRENTRLYQICSRGSRSSQFCLKVRQLFKSVPLHI